MIDGLIDDRNKNLYEELTENFEIQVELKTNTNEYGCYSQNNKSIIYVPSGNICSDSFTHELLHIFIRSKQVYIGGTIKRQIQSSRNLSKVFSSALLEHISNCLDHIKMLPKYLEMGFSAEKFILDYEVNKCTDIEIVDLKNHWKVHNYYNSQAIDFYLGKYFAIKACPNLNWNYEEKLKELENIDTNLFQINNKLIERWKAMNMESDDILEDDYIIIGGDYIDDMENWIKNKNIK